MSNASLLPRNLIVFGVVVPLALILGYLMATPDAFTSVAAVGLVIGILSIPVFLRWHHPLLIFTWNAGMNAFFLPGRPSVWMVIGGISLGITLLTCILNKEHKFQHVSSMNWAIAGLLAVVLVTAKVNGGFGLRALGGSQYGGKGYVFIIAAIVGYFALSSVRVPPHRVKLFALLFFLSGFTYMISDLAYRLGPSFWFLFYAFPVEMAISQAVSDFTPGEGLTRLAGLGFGALAVCYTMVLHYGVRGLMDPRRFWRPLLFALAVGVTFLGGFRVSLVMIGLLFLIQFCIEGLWRTRFMIALMVCCVLGMALLIPVVPKLPLSIQRVFTVVPFIEVNPVAKMQAEASLEWRLEMWRVLLPEVQARLLMGKGYGINPTDLFLAEESARRGLVLAHESAAVLAGDYHSGPLSLIIPFGIFGVATFAIVLIVGGRIIYRNWKYGDPRFRSINAFLWSFFLMRVIFYFAVFGTFFTDIPVFLGLVAFSIAINGGERKQAKQTEPAAVSATAAPDAQLLPA